ncbi:MAG: tRNA dimethylallyltransferase [candidate division BRC1 bacterium ADurb.BinA292]|nr:MAG: tRNA dimethylallyltransferase [candidate division BRC1 bacterium ADurb.BinA292]
MAEPARLPALLLSGPTGIGKSALALRLADELPLEIVSADSMQIYRGLAIGTAQPSAEERRRVPTHLVGELDPTERFDARRFVERADQLRREIHARGRLPVFVGGTGLYLRALRWGLFEGGGRDEAVRAALAAEARQAGPAALHARLARVDPAAAERIAPNDAVRIVRALEVHVLTGRRLSELQRQWSAPAPRFPHLLVVLFERRDRLRERIARRADAMLAAGWIDEVAELLARGNPPEAHCFRALGYREIIAHLRGELSRDALAERIATATVQFAKRQMVWFRRERPAIWLPAGDGDAGERVADLAWLARRLLAECGAAR